VIAGVGLFALLALGTVLFATMAGHSWSDAVYLTVLDAAGAAQPDTQLGLPSPSGSNVLRVPPSHDPSKLAVENHENVPCVPRRSGVDIADNWRPLNWSGGNVTGTRRIVLPI